MWLCDRLTKALDLLAEKKKIEEIVYIEDPPEVFAEVQKIVRLMFPKFDFAPVSQALEDVVRLFAGRYPGYRKCNTFYHDLNHTTDCLLVITRLIHGAFVHGIPWREKDVRLGLVSALLHDTGYIQKVEDDCGTGAKYTITHIDRSIEFMEGYFRKQGYSREDFLVCRNYLRCTGLEVKIDKINFKSREQAIMGRILGAADLIGQMSDKNYLEKLPFLYHEFAEGGVPGYKDELDLFEKTPHFWEVVKKRFAGELGGVDRYLRDHFRVYCGIDQDLYRKAIEQNLKSLQAILANATVAYAAYPEQEDICWV